MDVDVKGSSSPPRSPVRAAFGSWTCELVRLRPLVDCCSQLDCPGVLKLTRLPMRAPVLRRRFAKERSW